MEGPQNWITRSGQHVAPKKLNRLVSTGYHVEEAFRLGNIIVKLSTWILRHSGNNPQRLSNAQSAALGQPRWRRRNVLRG